MVVTYFYRNMYVLVTLVLALSSQCVLAQDGPLLGGIFYKDSEDMKVALDVSAKIFNFTTSIKEVSMRGEVLEISKYVCELAEEGVVGIIDGTGGRASENVQALCDMLELPHVIIQHNDLYCNNWSVLNMYPSPAAYNMCNPDKPCCDDFLKCQQVSPTGSKELTYCVYATN